MEYITVIQDCSCVSAPKKEDEFVLNTAENKWNPWRRWILFFFVKSPGLWVGVETPHIIEVLAFLISSKNEELVLVFYHNEISFVFRF